MMSKISQPFIFVDEPSNCKTMVSYMCICACSYSPELWKCVVKYRVLDSLEIPFNHYTLDEISFKFHFTLRGILSMSTYRSFLSYIKFSLFDLLSYNFKTIGRLYKSYFIETWSDLIVKCLTQFTFSFILRHVIN